MNYLVYFLALVAPPVEPTGQVQGTVLLLRELPPPRVYTLEADMRRATNQETLVDLTYRVGKNGGLADCVVTLQPLDPAGKRAVQPLPAARFDKVGAGYEPRLLVVPAGTRVTMANKGSPCNGFTAASSYHSFSRLVPPGKSFSYTFTRRDFVSVKCIRPYMLGWIVVVDTPWYAVTDKDGRCTIRDLPPGRYRLSIWHEAEGRIEKKAGLKEVLVHKGKLTALRVEVK